MKINFQAIASLAIKTSCSFIRGQQLDLVREKSGVCRNHRDGSRPRSPLTPKRVQLHGCHSKSFTGSCTVSPVCLSEADLNRQRRIDLQSPLLFSLLPSLFSFLSLSFLPGRLISSQVQDSRSLLFEREEIWGWVNIRALTAGITTPIYHCDSSLFSG